ncbi:hypothetical protein [Edaphobacter bradus]|uniref:hypothetical protein n=1 Tax=Edaphobacter bradus TaxID=2259016 RepID=UPI0021E09176|nr:hypothetical protein [Edaphobacter bradus]
MTNSEFVNALKVQTSDAAVFGTVANLERPPGRKPRERDVTLSKWYGNLTSSDKAFVNTVIREAAELAVFSFLCVLDGVSAIEDGPEKGDLRLIYTKNGIELLLNGSSQEFLHDSYNALCQASDPIAPERPEVRVYEVDSAQHLREKQTSADGMDLHSVLPITSKTPVPEAPSIALPKNEHRKL